MTPAPGASPIIDVRGLTRRYGEVLAAEDVSFAIDRGEMFGLIGPDGAGKTTTIRVLLGLLAPNTGSVRTCGLDPLREGPALSRKIGYLSQRFSLYGDLSIDENISFFATLHGTPGWRARREELLDLLKLARFRERLAERLSGGMKQKLALACTLIHTPELLVLDEPTTGVDPVSRREFWKILARLQHEGLTILVTTPYLDEAERCQRVGLMNAGRLLTVSTPGELRESLPGAFLEVVTTAPRRAANALAALAEVGDVVGFGERLHVRLPAIDSPQLPALSRRIEEALAASGIEVLTLRQIQPSLEDVFIARMTQAAAEVA